MVFVSFILLDHSLDHWIIVRRIARLVTVIDRLGIRVLIVVVSIPKFVLYTSSI